MSYSALEQAILSSLGETGNVDSATASAMNAAKLRLARAIASAVHDYVQEEITSRMAKLAQGAFISVPSGGPVTPGPSFPQVLQPSPRS